MSSNEDSQPPGLIRGGMGAGERPPGSRTPASASALSEMAGALGIAWIELVKSLTAAGTLDRSYLHTRLQRSHDLFIEQGNHGGAAILAALIASTKDDV